MATYIFARQLNGNIKCTLNGNVRYIPGDGWSVDPTETSIIISKPGERSIEIVVSGNSIFDANGELTTTPAEIAEGLTASTFFKTSGAGGGGGGTQSLDDTLAIGNTTDLPMIFDATYPKPPDSSSPVSQTWLTFKPLVKTDVAENAAFYFNQGGFLNNGKTNEVMLFGWNIGAGGGQAEAGKPGIGESWEQNYQTDPDGTGARYVEKHEYYIKPNGTQVRIGSYTIDSDADTIQFYHSVDLFQIYNPDTATPYFALLGVADGTSLSLKNTSDQTEEFSIVADFNEDATTANLTIGNSSGKANNTFALQSFNLAKLPATVRLAPLTGNATQIALLKGDGSTAASLSSTGTTSLLNSLLGNLQLAASNTLVAELQSTVLNIFKDVTVGGHTTAVAPLDVRTGTINQAAYFEQSKTSGNAYAAIFTALGAGTANNVGIIVGANGGATNKAIRIDNPSTAGADNFAIYSNNPVKSYHAGKLGLGDSNLTPLALLDIRNTTDNQATYIETNKGTGNAFGIIVTSLGAGSSTNIGINTGASNGSTNIGLKIDNPVSGANNWAIRSISTAKSEFDGPITATQFNVGSSLNTAPASATATGTAGEIRITATHIYVCTATNTWVRAALATW